MIIELSIFSRQYLEQITRTETALQASEQRLTLVQRKIKVLQDTLPALLNDGVWKEAYLELENLQRSELTESQNREYLWGKIKSIIGVSEEGDTNNVIFIDQIRNRKTY